MSVSQINIQDFQVDFFILLSNKFIWQFVDPSCWSKWLYYNYFSSSPQDLEQEKCNAYEKDGKEKLRIFTTAAGCLTKIDALVKLGKEVEALKVCVR